MTESIRSVLGCSLAAFFLFGSGARADETAPREPIQLNVAAFNVRVGENATPEGIGYALKRFELDVVCFSEAPGGDWTQRAGAILSMEHVVIGRYTTAGHTDKYKTIASKSPLYGYEEILMADTLHTVTRAVTQVEGKELAIYSVHFPYGWRDQAHIDETTGKIEAFLDYLKKRPEEEIAIVMGDFNFVPSNSESRNLYHERFKEIGLDLSWSELKINLSSRNTSGLFKPEEERMGRVIDHIMYDPRKIRAIDGGIVETKEPLSDHKPVWARLQLR